jgi:hypothetical protein
MLMGENEGNEGIEGNEGNENERNERIIYSNWSLGH